MQTLEKARKDDLTALGPHADWATKTLQYNDNGKPKEHAPHLNWLANGVRKDPNILTPEHKTKIEHFASMYHLPSVKGANLSGHTIDSGLENLHQAEQKGIASMPSKGLVTPKGHVIAQGENGRQWHNLGVAGCEEEGKAGNHCGNMPAYKDGRGHERLLSLRGSSNTPGKLKQHLTFVNNDGYITEMKGNTNTKPKAEYHGDIVSLMEHPEIKGMVGGGFASGSNFDPDDVTDPELRERMQRVLEKKPNFFSPDKSDLHPTVTRDPFLAYTVTDKKAKNAIDKEPDSIATNNLSYDDQMDLARDGTESIKEDLARNPNIHPDAQATLARDGAPLSQAYLAENPNLHPDHQATLARDGSYSLKTALAANPNLHPDTQTTLARDKAQSVKATLAANPNIHPDTQTTLARDADSAIRDSLARPHSIMGTNARDCAQSVKTALARNLNIHPDLQATLARDADGAVKMALAYNPNLHPEHQASLARDADEDVRRGLAYNRNIHPDIQATLARDADEDVQATLAKNPNLHPEHQATLARDVGAAIKMALSKNPNLHPDTQTTLARDGDDDVWSSLAENPNLHPDIQATLARDGDDDVRSSLAYNPNLHPESAKVVEKHLRNIISQADQDHPPTIQKARAAGNSLQTLRKNQLIQRLKSKDSSPEFIKRYEFSHNKEVRNAAQESLKKLGKSEKQGHAVLAKSHAALSLLKSFKQATVKKSSPCRYAKRRENT